jgi:hypothetical protein
MKFYALALCLAGTLAVCGTARAQSDTNRDQDRDRAARTDRMNRDRNERRHMDRDGSRTDSDPALKELDRKYLDNMSGERLSRLDRYRLEQAWMDRDRMYGARMGGSRWEEETRMRERMAEERLNRSVERMKRMRESDSQNGADRNRTGTEPRR